MVAILLLVTDVTVFTPDAAAWGLQLHHDSLLGPVNDVAGGRSMLVDAYSIYGVGSVYFLAGLFELVPLGYGSFGLLVGAPCRDVRRRVRDPAPRGVLAGRSR